MESNPDTFLSSTVKTLCLSSAVDVHTGTKILGTCTGVDNLACWINHKIHSGPRWSASPLVDCIFNLHLRRLSIGTTYLLDVLRSSSGPDGSKLSLLTHIDIIVQSQDGLPSSLSGIDALPSLTHLALYLPYDLGIDKISQTMVSLLASCRSLKIMALVTVVEEPLLEAETVSKVEPSIPISDPRVAWIPYPENIILDWEASHRGDVHVWSIAETIVTRQIALKEQTRCVDSRTTGQPVSDISANSRMKPV
jgi:hypothetical protein